MQIPRIQGPKGVLERTPSPDGHEGTKPELPKVRDSLFRYVRFQDYRPRSEAPGKIDCAHTAGFWNACFWRCLMRSPQATLSLPVQGKSMRTPLPRSTLKEAAQIPL